MSNENCKCCIKSQRVECPIAQYEPWRRQPFGCSEFLPQHREFIPTEVIQNERIELLANAIIKNAIDTDHFCVYCDIQQGYGYKVEKHKETCIVLTAKRILEQMK